jgi:hypothetical protein
MFAAGVVIIKLLAKHIVLPHSKADRKNASHGRVR